LRIRGGKKRQDHSKDLCIWERTEEHRFFERTNNKNSIKNTRMSRQEFNLNPKNPNFFLPIDHDIFIYSYLLSVLLVAVFNFIICVASKSVSLFVVNLTIIIITQPPNVQIIISSFSVYLLYRRRHAYFLSTLSL